MRLSKRHEH